MAVIDSGLPCLRRGLPTMPVTFHAALTADCRFPGIFHAKVSEARWLRDRIARQIHRNRRNSQTFGKIILKTLQKIHIK